MLIEIDEKLVNQINEYCLLNEIDEKKFIYKLLNKQFMVEKYGEKPGNINFIEPNNTSINKLVEIISVYRNTLLENMGVPSHLMLNEKKESLIDENKENVEFNNGIVMVNIDKPQIKRKRQLK